VNRLNGRKPPSAAYPRLLRTLADHLRQRRLDLGLLQREVADRLGVNAMTVCNWETNRTSPQLRFIPRIIVFLGYYPDDVPPQSLGERITAYRRRLGLSQRRLARLLDIDLGTLSRWERGKSLPSDELVRTLNAFLTRYVSD
jgi:transcriptional regulator with XRE-family HTH domain